MEWLASRLAILMVAALSACPATDPPVPTTDTADTADTADTEDISGEVFDPSKTAPYDCNYEAAGSYSKISADACNLLDQDCTNTTLACSLTNQGAQCLPIGDKTCGFPCEQVNHCAPGLLCVGEPLACRALCRPGDPCPGHTVCRDISGRTDIGFCPVPCSVLTQECPGGDACYLLFGRQECAPTASFASVLGESCNAGDECAAGLVCQDASNLRCLAPCTTDGAYACVDESESCVPLSGLEPLGVCIAE